MSESRFPHQRRIEQTLILRKLQSYEEIEVRVVREISHAKGACGYEAAHRNPDAEFWREPSTRAFKKRAQAYRYISPIYRSRPQRCLRDQWIGVKPSPGGAGVKNIEPYCGTPRFEVAAPYSPGSPCIPLSSGIVHEPSEERVLP